MKKILGDKSGTMPSLKNLTSRRLEWLKSTQAQYLSETINEKDN